VLRVGWLEREPLPDRVCRVCKQGDPDNLHSSDSDQDAAERRSRLGRRTDNYSDGPLVRAGVSLDNLRAGHAARLPGLRPFSHELALLALTSGAIAEGALVRVAPAAACGGARRFAAAPAVSMCQAMPAPPASGCCSGEPRALSADAGHNAELTNGYATSGAGSASRRMSCDPVLPPVADLERQKRRICMALSGHGAASRAAAQS